MWTRSWGWDDDELAAKLEADNGYELDDVVVVVAEQSAGMVAYMEAELPAEMVAGIVEEMV